MLAYRTNPTMPKKMHAADATDRAKIASATGYITSFFLGRGNYDRHPSPALERARQVGQQMLADPDYAKTGRKPIIYALLPDGSEVLVPDDYQVGELPGENVAADHVEMAAKPLITPAPDAGKASTTVDLQPVADAMAALAAFPGLKKLSQRHLDLLESAQAGVLPTPPDSSAKSWDGNVYRGRLQKLAALVDAGDIAALEAEKLPTYDSGFVAMARYRNLAVIALKARAARRGVS